MSKRTHIILQDTSVPLTPLDECWSVDGRVYVKFVESSLPSRVVGRLEDPTLAGRYNIDIIATCLDRIPVLVHPCGDIILE